MRVTNSLFYTNAANDYQRNMQELYKVNTQISSGLKIQNSFEDSGVYVDTMRLNYEVATLEQIKESSSKAQTYTNNTDNVLNQFNDSLNTFKTKMVQASSEIHSSTSLNAIADELESLKTNLMTLGNTSINGEFLFSGSAISVKPISSDGTYNGNDETREAVVGSNIKLPYNIDGQELFLGTDSDYNRVVSTNVQMLNQSKLYPAIMVEYSGVTESEEVYLTAEDTIRDLVGDFDNDATNDPNAMFYISGRKSNGDTFSDKIEMKSDEKVSELLEEIGKSFGNTSTNTMASVRLNEHGQVEVKDLKTGGKLLEMSLFGAVDRDAGAGFIGDASKISVDDLMKESNVQIIEFQKTGFKSENSAYKIATRQNIYVPGQFKLGAPMTDSDGLAVKTSTKLRSFMGDEVNQISFSGQNNSGNNINPIPPNDVLRIDDNTTVQGLLNSIETAYGMSARLEDGQIYMEGGSNSDFEANKLNAVLEAYSFAGDGEVQSFDITSSTTNADDFTVAGFDVAISHPSTAVEVAAAIEAEESNIMATDANIASVRADGSKVYIDYKESAGDVADVVLNPNNTGITTSLINPESNYIASGLSEVQFFEIKEDPTVDGTITIAGVTINFGPSTPATDTAIEIAQAIKDQEGLIISGNPEISSISVENEKVIFTYNSTAGNTDTIEPTISNPDDLIITPTKDRTVTQGSLIDTAEVFATFDSMNYEKRGFEKDGNKLLSNISQIIKKTNSFASNSTKLSEVSGVDSLNNSILEFNFTNKNGDMSKGQINLLDVGSTFQVDFDNSGSYEPNEIIDLFNVAGVATKADDVTYQQISDVLALAMSGQHPVDRDEVDIDTGAFVSLADGKLFPEYEESLKTARSSVDVKLDSRGRLEITDRKNSDTKMALSLFDSKSGTNDTAAFSFMANDAVKIEDPTIDFYKDLDDIIKAVRNGEFQMSSDNEDPRSLGLNNSLTKIDHLMDHIVKSQTKIGSYSNALSQTNERSELLSINIQTIRSQVIDVDIGEAYMKFNQLSNSYQAMLSTVAKINSMTLLNYM